MTDETYLLDKFIDEDHPAFPIFLPYFQEVIALSFLLTWSGYDLKIIIAQQEKLLEDLFNNPKKIEAKPYLVQTQDEKIRIVKDILPVYLSYIFVTGLWAIFESTITQSSEFLRKIQKQNLKLQRIRGDGFLGQAKIYFRDILHFPIYGDPNLYKIFQDFYFLRNAIVHGNGFLENLKTPKKSENRIREIEGVEIQNNRIIFTELYLNLISSIVYAFMVSLVSRITEKYPKNESLES